MDGLLDTGLETTRWLQSNYPQLRGLLLLVSALGTEDFYLLFVPLIYWCLDKQMGKHLAFLFLIAANLNAIAKHAARGSRPFWLDDTIGLSTESQYGVPSGHVQSATVTYLFIAGRLRRRIIWVLCLLFVFLMALSRVYLGVHFLQDVIAGFLLGVLILTGYVVWQRLFSRRLQKQILGLRLLVAVSIPAALAILYALVRLLIGVPDTAVAWATFIPDAERAGLEQVATGFGALLGASIGLTLESSRVRFLTEGGPWLRVARYVVGILITLLIWGGLRSVFPADPLWLAIPLRILRYLLTLLWVSYWAPMAFVRIGLADAEPEPEINISLREENGVI